MLDDILFEYKPNNWTNVNYSNKRYVLIEISRNDTEYGDVTAPFGNKKIDTVERVQHPYALGYYMLRRKQLMNRGYIYEERRYHPITPSVESVAVEYNLDVRKYDFVHGHGKTISTFFKVPKLYINVNKLIPRHTTFIVCKALVDESNRNVSVIEPSYESEYMPEYIVKLVRYHS